MRATASRRAKTDAPRGGAIEYGPLEDQLGYALRRAQLAVFRDFFRKFERFDIRPAQYAILTIIECNPGLRQSEVSEALGIKRANFVAMIDALERRKLVRRDPAPNDRRSYALRLTGAGERLVGELHAVAGRHEQRLVDALGSETRRRMIVSLGKLARIGGDEPGPG